LAEAAITRPGSQGASVPPYWPALAGFLLLAVPTILSLGAQVWSRESGAHGPLLLAAGLWLLGRERETMVAAARPGSLWVMAPLTVAALAVYVFGRAYDFLVLEAAGLYGVGVMMLYAHLGFRALRQQWFPLLYLSLVIPPPNWLLDKVTAPLKHFVSYAATTLLSAAGLPISRGGVVIYIGPYQLLVEDACSGMNSLIGLIAISLLYVYLARRGGVIYSLVMVACAIPIAIIANIARITVIVLLTEFAGDAVAQGFAHFATGIFLFSVALLLVFLVDTLMAAVLLRGKKGAAGAAA
jgi:exosortase